MDSPHMHTAQWKYALPEFGKNIPLQEGMSRFEVGTIEVTERVRERVKRVEKHRKNSNGVENEAHIYNFRCLYHVPSSTHSVVSQRMRARGTIQTF